MLQQPKQPLLLLTLLLLPPLQLLTQPHQPLLTLLLLTLPLLRLLLPTLLRPLRTLLPLLRKPLRLLLLPSNWHRDCRLRTASRTTALHGRFCFLRPPFMGGFILGVGKSVCPGFSTRR
ncbi:hypothetical protein GCM10007386_15940 [Pseudoduganella dura]|nr:hypothetical protein GCM10007386_15940 [Pseudoduganella dura]